MSLPVRIGATIHGGLHDAKLIKSLNLGDCVFAVIPKSREELHALADYCKENCLYLYFWEFVIRGSKEYVGECWDRQVPLDEFYSKQELESVVASMGQYYKGRTTIGEAGEILYCLKTYAEEWKGELYQNLPPVDTMAEAKDAYVQYLKGFVDFERNVVGIPPLLNVESGLVFKYHVEAGIDVLLHEMMPGDPHLIQSSMRGAAKAFEKPWGTHIAMECYGSYHFDDLYLKRWKTSLYYSYITGAQFIWPESGFFRYNQDRGQAFDFESREMRSVRSILRECFQFVRIHTRPDEPRVALGVVHGNLDGNPGLWNRYVWGEHHDDKWLIGPAEKGWSFVDSFHRKEEWNKASVRGDMDFSGNPPYGQYDVVPIESSLHHLKRYSCLVFLGWNTMTPEIYEKLKEYVASGGHLLMFLPHLSTHIDRADDLKLFNDGDFSDLFGVKILEKGTKDVRGINCFAESSIPSYGFPVWRTRTDPRFIGNMTPTQVELTTGKVISGHADRYRKTADELAQNPVLIENTLGAGTAYLVTLWEYPGDEEIRPFVSDLLRTILDGEQGEIRLLSSDRVRYAVYEESIAGEQINIIYLLNTDPDCSYQAQLWIAGRLTDKFTVPANDLRLAYRIGDVILVPEDKRVDIHSLRVEEDSVQIDMYSFLDQQIEVHNLGKSDVSVCINGKAQLYSSGESKQMMLRRTVDPDREKFFAQDFLIEPNCE